MTLMCSGRAVKGSLLDSSATLTGRPQFFQKKLLTPSNKSAILKEK